MSTAIQLIFTERINQVRVKGYTSEHDDGNESTGWGDTNAPLVMAAIGYLRRSPGWWPSNWNSTKFKLSPGISSKDRIRELVKAGALIVAEIERLQRKPND